MPNLQVTSFQNCCTAKIIYGFDGSSAAAHGNSAQPKKEELSEALKAKMEHVSRTGQGIAVAMITSEQVVAKEVLESMGWKLATESNKNNHSDTTLLCYTWAVKPDNKQAVIVNPFAKPPSPAKDYSSLSVYESDEEFKIIQEAIEQGTFWNRSREIHAVLQKVDPSVLVSQNKVVQWDTWQAMEGDKKPFKSTGLKVQYMERSWLDKPKRWLNRLDKNKNIRLSEDIPWDRVAMYRVVR